MSRIESHGWSKVEARLLRRLNGLGGPAMVRALDRVGAEVVGRYRQSIAAGRSPYHKFPKLSEPYAKRKLKRYGTQPILVATGAMRDSLGHKLTVLGVGRYRLECGAGGVDSSGVSNGDKALWHIDGTPKMPRRDFGRLNKSLLRQALTEALRAELVASPVPARG